MNQQSINAYVDIYIAQVSSEEKGWSPESMLSKLMVYRGSFQDTKKVTGLEKYVDQVKKEHKKFRTINAAMKRLDHPVAIAILAKRYLQGLNERTDRSYTNQDRAFYSGQKPRQFENNLARAYKKLSELREMREEV